MPPPQAPMPILHHACRKCCERYKFCYFSSFGTVIADTTGESAGILTETTGPGYDLLIQNKEQVTNKQLLKNFLATPLSLSTCKEQQHTHLGRSSKQVLITTHSATPSTTRDGSREKQRETETHTHGHRETDRQRVQPHTF